MATRSSTPGAPCWNDLASADPDRAQEFYTRLFGWSAQDAGEEYAHYVNFAKDGVVVAGMMRNDPAWGLPDGWSTYLASLDAKATAVAAVGAGGHVVIEPMDLMGLGWMTVVADAAGGAVGVWQAGTHPGFGVTGLPGTPAYHELHTREYRGAVEFYEKVFGAGMTVVSDSDEWRYTNLLDADGEPVAGIMDASASQPEGLAPSWHVYFAVDDVDAAVARVEELGGSVLEPPADTPYGPLARVADPTGVTFKLSRAQS